MYGLLLTPFAPLFEFDFSLNLFFILSAPIVNALAGGAGKFDESILGHTILLYVYAQTMRVSLSEPLKKGNFLNGAPGWIRTNEAQGARDLQSLVFDHSTTDANRENITYYDYFVTPCRKRDSAIERPFPFFTSKANSPFFTLTIISPPRITFFPIMADAA